MDSGKVNAVSGTLPMKTFQKTLFRGFDKLPRDGACPQHAAVSVPVQNEETDQKGGRGPAGLVRLAPYDSKGKANAVRHHRAQTRLQRGVVILGASGYNRTR
jgi:hypothetical protein